ncbi:MAG: G5 domain-containing protein [Clostridia bacterium]|nr:G5 domain-containing protein [Clostridia bacterium]
MEQFKRIMGTLWDGVRYVVSRRVFAAVLMCAVTISMVLSISVNSRVVTVNDGEDSRVVVTVHQDPHQVLHSAGVKLEEHDEISVDADSAVIDVDRAMAVQVQADGLSTLVHLTDGTVKDAIDKAGVAVGKYDTVNQQMTTNVSEGMLIEVDRVTYEEYTVKKAVDYEVVYKYSAVLRPGQSKVRTAGVQGERTITYRKTIVNGKVVETTQVSDVVTKKPVNKIILKGTTLGTPLSKAPFNIELDEGGQPVKYKKLLTGQCTAYTNDEGDSGSWTATGKHVAVGLVAVDPRVIPYGTKMWITSADGKMVYGYAIAADTGSAMRSGRVLVDLFMDTNAECKAFGRRNMNVYILE